MSKTEHNCMEKKCPLCPDTTRLCLEFLGARTLAMAGGVCVEFYQVSRKNALWEKFLPTFGVKAKPLFEGNVACVCFPVNTHTRCGKIIFGTCFCGPRSKRRLTTHKIN